ncbi:MAG: V-type ATP synthase subunit C [Armatimonadetes bacterium CG07_land_8_20_14_0_80_40_9]|nr:MAG: V-type ATP synthase subunit C [Armatimonadetes bacterium CG07_land_8_20_14_0_80_40_9]
MIDFIDFKEDTRYAFAVGKIRVLESRLIDKAGIERMVEASDAQGVLNILNETEYATSISNLKSIYDFETILNDELKKVLKLISDLSNEPKLTALFLLKYDFQNLKSLTKSKYFKKDLDNLLIEGALIDIEKLKEIFGEERFGDLPYNISEIVKKALEEVEKSKEPQIIDIIYDKELYSLLYSKSEEAGNPFIKQFFQISIDLANLKTFIRVKELNLEREFLEKVLLDFGFIEKKTLLEMYEERVDTLLQRLAYTPYRKVLEEGLKDWKKERSFRQFERCCNNFILEFLSKTRYVVFGVEPLIGYLIAKENEITTIRVIMIGKLNNLSKETILERVESSQ